MKLTGFETQIVELPRDSGPMGASALFVTLKLRTGDGIEGIGYAGFTSALMMKALRETLDALTEQALGSDPMMIEAIGARLLSMGGGGSPSGLVTRAVSAIDVALWDIRGKALGQPVYRLLGGFADRVPAYASGHLWRTYDLDMLAKTGPEIVESGFRAMKFRMGGEDTDAKEIERMRVMREAIGDDIDLMVDINQGWDINTTLRIGRLRWPTTISTGSKTRHTTRTTSDTPASPTPSTLPSPPASTTTAQSRSDICSKTAPSTS